MELILLITAILYFVGIVITGAILVATVETPVTHKLLFLFLGFSLVWPILIVTYFGSGRN